MGWRPGNGSDAAPMTSRRSRVLRMEYQVEGAVDCDRTDFCEMDFYESGIE